MVACDLGTSKLDKAGYGTSMVHAGVLPCGLITGKLYHFPSPVGTLLCPRMIALGDRFYFFFFLFGTED